jgi:hypothetical protein
MTVLAFLLLAANPCAVPWDPVQVLPPDAQQYLEAARPTSPCRVKSLPAPVREYLSESIGDRKQVMADPDKKWNNGCLLVDGTPSRQLIAAASSARRWVVHYRQGGFVSSEVAVVVEVNDDQSVRQLWRGVCLDTGARLGSVDDVLGLVTHRCYADQR